MKHRVFGLIVLVCLILSVGCSQEGSEPAPVAPATTGSRNEPVAKPLEAGARTDGVAKGGQAGSEYVLTYTAGAGGSVDGDSPQVVIPGGSGKPVMATPSVGYRFAGWSDGVTSASRTDTNVTANLAVIASFAMIPHNLVYIAGEHGSLSGPARQTVDPGSSGRPIKAVPEPGYHFVGWSDGVVENPRTDANVTGDLSVTANFAVNQYTLTYAAEANGSIGGSNPQTVNHGSAGTLVTAVPAAGYHFLAWSDGLTTPERTDVDVSADISVSAKFEPDTYTVGGTVIGLAAGGKVVLNNAEEDVTVMANGEFIFPARFADGRPYAVTVKIQPAVPSQTCSVTGGAGTIAGENVSGVKIECKYAVYTVGGTMSGLPEGNHVVLQNNQRDDLVVSANGKFNFAGPLNDGSLYEVTILSQKLQPKWFCSVEKASGTLAGDNVASIDVACFPEAELLAVPSLGKIEVNWNSKDFRGATFNLCRARQDIDPIGFSQCKALADGVLETKVKSPHALSPLVNDVPYWFQLEVQHPGGRRTYSQIVTATPFGGLNDTGIDWCADFNANRNQSGTRLEKNSGCDAVAATYPGQDAHRGRDADDRLRKLSKSGSGSAGFDFTKVCASGKLAGEGDCPPNPTLGSAPDNWACVRDNVTGLVWEVKTSKGLRGQGNSYTWYNPDTAENGGAAGTQNGGRCEGSNCDTHAYAQEVNKQGLCGANDWRLPTRKELLSIVDNGQLKPAIDGNYFPNTPSAHFWSSSPYADKTGLAWQVYFQYGEALTAEKGQDGQVRLVRREK